MPPLTERPSYSCTRLPVKISKYIEVPCHISLKGTAPHLTLLYESQNIDVLHTCLGSKTALIQITSDMTPMEFFAAGWCIGNSSCEWKLCFSSVQPFQVDCMEMFLAGIRRLHTASKDTGKVSELHISRGMMNSDSVVQEMFFKLLDNYVDSMQKIIHFYGHGSVQSVHNGQLFCTHLANMIKNSTHLKEIKLISPKVVDIDSLATKEFVKYQKPILVPTIFNAISLNKSIKKLELVYIEHSKELMKMLNYMKCTLTHLSIQHDCMLNDNPLKALPCLGSTLVSIDLTGTHLVRGDVVIFILEELTSVEHLKLEECRIHEIGSITQKLKVNKSLKTLDLSGNYLKPCGQHLAEMLNMNQTLQVLRLYQCGLTQDDTTALFQVFTANQNTTLRTLHIGDNSFHTQHLREMISSNSSLQCVEITVTPVRKENDNRDTSSPVEVTFGGSNFVLGPRMLTRDYQQNERSSDDSDVVLAYVPKDDTLDSVCQMTVSAMNKNTTLQNLVIHTVLSEAKLESELKQCRDYDKVRGRIQIIKSRHHYI